MTPKDYKDNFHNVHLQHSLDSANEIVPLFLSYFKPKEVLDVGCGLGTWLSVFKAHSCNVLGIDGDYVSTDDLLIEPSYFKTHDLNKTLDLKQKFDLVISLEVAEHLQKQNANTFIDSICAHSDIVLFSAAIPGQEGTLHYNEQYNEYWVNLFAKKGYKCIDFLRHNVWNNKKISWWYRQNILIFINEKEIENSKYAKICDEGSTFRNSYVHPELFNYKQEKAKKLQKILNSPKEILKYYLRKKKIY
jgi:SAM-dependent methyltransferase